MPDHNIAETVQLNLATEQRNAARDYHEYFMPGSIKLVLATSSKTKLDEMAVDNSRMFRYRFGFEPHAAVRKQVVDIQNKYDFTDSEIRWLRRSGQLTISTDDAKISASRLMPIFGWLQLIILGAVLFGMIAKIRVSTAPAWEQALGEVLVFGLTYGVFWIFYSLYIEPSRIIKRSQVLSGAPKQG